MDVCRLSEDRVFALKMPTPSTYGKPAVSGIDTYKNKKAESQ
jgi:hypothetical protein